MKRGVLHTVLLFFLVSLLAGCSTEKNTRASRAYHNLTSKYNIYFNGKESLKAGIDKIEKTVEDDYTRILPVYKESYQAAANTGRADMDNAVFKGTKLIQTHSITKKPKRRRFRTRSYQEFASKEDFNHWIDDSYLLIGQAYFYQHNFVASLNNFSQVTRKFPAEETNYDALVWLIRTNSELERFTEASELMQMLQADKEFPRRLEKELAKASADYYLKQKDYAEAIKFLDITIKKTFWKKNKARLYYILAQLYRETGNIAMATKSFQNVSKMNPPYKLAFNARINAAGIFSGEGDAAKLQKDLNKMLRDEKNLEFRDQIYFALGNIFFKQGNRDKAIENYRKSVTASTDNNFQRTLSSVTLADLYFQDLKYREAQAYYDSAMMVMEDNYIDYEKLSTRSASLNRLVDNLVTVEVQDSLQKLALMPENERNNLIDKYIAREQQKIRDAEVLANQQQNERGFYRANEYRFGLGRSEEGSGWYFYNPQTVSYGKAQFSQRWGRRKLEDDWRRLNKNIVPDSEMDEFAQVIDSTKLIVRQQDPMQRSFYTQDLPVTDSLMTISHEKIKDALYNAGKIFKSDFNDFARSAETFEELNRRYPDNIFQLSTFFDLYDLYELLGNTPKSNEYRNLIINRFPNSKYAKYLQNPNFFIDMAARQDTINRIYQNAFRDYKSGRYGMVAQQVSQIKQFEPDSTLMAKIDFMGAVARGVQADIPNFTTLLKGYIANYPKTETTTLAKEILALLQDNQLSDYKKLVEMGYLHDEIQNTEITTGKNEENDEFGGKFSYDDDLLHYFAIVFPRQANIDLNRLKFDIANYNLDHYTKLDFDIESETLDANNNLLIVRSLTSKEQALIYFRAIIRQSAVFRTLKDIEYYNFVISSTNYRQILAEKSAIDYLKFYLKNYSRLIGPDFKNEGLPGESPEEQMARAAREDELLREKGKFVSVGIKANEGIFSAAIDTTQSFVLAVRDKNMSLRPALTQFADFNRAEFRIWNLALQLKQAGEYQLMVVKGMPGYTESMSYFRKVILNRELFKSLGQSVYRNFLITDVNLEKLVQNGAVDGYMDFFRANYIQRGGQVPAATGTIPVAEPQIRQQNLPFAPSTPELPKYEGPFKTQTNLQNYFVLIVPLEGFDKARLVSSIQSFNRASFSQLPLAVDEARLDDFRGIIRVTGLETKISAMAYMRQLTANREIFNLLGDASYRNFLITPENYPIFTVRKNITEYMDFYRIQYLAQ